MPARFGLTVVLSVFAMGCGTATIAPPEQGALEAATAARVRSLLEEQMLNQHIPGVAFAIVRDDRVVYLQSLGMRDLEQKLPVTADTLFPIGSCTKAFTSMALARSADGGALSFDDHPRKFLPYLRLADAETDARITVRDMLSHRTGLKANADLAAEPGVLTREEYVRAATSAKPTAPFRAKFQYSNAMFAAAGEIVGKVHGTTWERAIETDIFGPLQMNSSVTDLRIAGMTSDHVTGYLYDSASHSFRAASPPESLRAMAPAGSIASSARDMAQWLRMLTGGGRIGGKEFISPAQFRELTTPLIAVNATTSYALGWASYAWNGLRVVEHNGGSQGLSAVVSFIPERRVGFVFLANTSPNAMTSIGGAGKLLWPLLVGGAAPPPAPPSSAASLEIAEPKTVRDPPSLEALLARMIDAAGGERALREHTSVEIHARKWYENQGVFADVVTLAKAPSLRNEVEVWTAANREIGRVRIYFDGNRGGQETTFGQDAINDALANARASREYAFHRLLDLKRLYKDISVLRTEKVEGEDAWVVELSPENGSASRLFVSTRTALVLQREVEGELAAFHNYREVDGEMLPFRTTIRDALGESMVTINSIHFNVAMDDSAFQPIKK